MNFKQIALFICGLIISLDSSNATYNYDRFKLIFTSTPNDFKDEEILFDYRSSFREIYNQKEAGWCFAYTAADLLSFKLKKEISPLYLALQYYMLRSSREGFIISKVGGSFDDGLIETTLKLASENGVCETNGFGKGRTNLNFWEPSKLFPILFNHFDEIRSGKFVWDSMWAKYSELFIEQFLPSYSNELEELKKDLLREKNNKAFLLRAIKSNCEKPLILDTEFKIHQSSLFSITHKQRITMLDKIDHELSNGNVVVVAYNAVPLIKYGVTTISSKLLSMFVGLHLSTLVGLTKNSHTGEVSYILRNSFGKDCFTYRENLKCIDGHILISKKEALDIFKSTTYLSN